MNLPMVIEAYASRFSMETAHEIAAHISGTAKEGVRIRPEELEPVEAAPVAMLLFASPQDVVEVVEAGVDLKSVNIGGMRFGEGKKMITNFISVDSKDVESFLDLMNAGIELEIRQVPTDRKTDLMQLIKKEKMLQ